MHAHARPQQPNGLFKNYADDNSTDSFDDASSSALLAATVYRLALLTGNKKFVREAGRTLAVLFATNGTSANTSGIPVATSGSVPSPSSSGSAAGSESTASSAFADTPHFTVDGWLEPVVDPLNAGVQGTQSAEGQAFALMLQSAWRDSGKPRVNVAPMGARAGLSTVVLVVVCTLTMMDVLLAI